MTNYWVIMPGCLAFKIIVSQTDEDYRSSEYRCTTFAIRFLTFFEENEIGITTMGLRCATKTRCVHTTQRYALLLPNKPSNMSFQV